MNSGIIVGMSIALLLSVWTWIGLIIMNRVSLERKLEKLNSITNRLPEEEKQLRQLKDLRTIEQGKVSSSKWIVGLFMLMLVASMVAAPWWEPLQELFGFSILSRYEILAACILTFFCLPIYVGLTLAGSTTKDKSMDEAPKETVEKAAA
jgi:hypothetical protein